MKKRTRLHSRRVSSRVVVVVVVALSSPVAEFTPAVMRPRTSVSSAALASGYRRRNEQFKTMDRSVELELASVFISQILEQRRGKTFGGFRRTESGYVHRGWW